MRPKTLTHLNDGQLSPLQPKKMNGWGAISQQCSRAYHLDWGSFGIRTHRGGNSYFTGIISSRIPYSLNPTTADPS